ncbi:MAG: sortase [Lachnospiraceae bacterium]|nr:sortase [Lachnospiraceae bacterium]
MRRRLGTFFIALGVTLLIAALVWLAYNQWDNWRAGKSAAEIQEVLGSAEDEAKANQNDGSGLPDDLADEDGVREMGTLIIEGNAYIGTLSIPKYGLELPIMAEWSYPGLRIAPCRYQGSVWTDDMILCGHNYDRHFGNLKNLEPGDEISFVDVDGNEFYYEVAEVVILQPTDVEEMISRETGEWDLTLFTCTIGGQTRVTVRCTRVDEPEDNAS